ncbi:hypothetical protein BJX99DRAFT_225114 [Aspergillus californicus]
MRNRATTPLAKPKIRQSWSKYNLYNLNRLKAPYTRTRTFFQQKWTAKSMARDYHGEQVPERQWERMFSRRLRSVVPMSIRRLTENDGSAQALGRGLGLTPEKLSKKEQEEFDKDRDNRPLRPTPYMHMTFAPLERRLDVAVFRALFASSARQARQFVVHGAVTVNGKKMRYPGYLLNPGDMFQVEPERVMFATGAPKDRLERRLTRRDRNIAAREKAKEAEKEAEAEKATAKGEAEAEANEAEEDNFDTRTALTTLLAQSKNMMKDNKEILPGKRKQDIRGFQRLVRRVLSKSPDSKILTATLEKQFDELISRLQATVAKAGAASQTTQPEKTESAPASTTEPAPAAKAEDIRPAAETTSDSTPSDALSEAFRQATSGGEVDTSELSFEDVDALKRALVQMRDNPVDNSKPYSTPWRPRDYMCAFATIPRYLEVNQNICAAVYLRHPVARPGKSEIPSPFGDSVHTGAFSWYLRRR